MQITEQILLQEITKFHQIFLNWKYEEIGIITVGYEDYFKLCPQNEIDSKILIIHEKSIGLFFEMTSTLYKFCLKHMKEYPLECSTICLMINGDNTLAWTTRFSLAFELKQLNKQNELLFSKCLTHRFKKGTLIYHYRRLWYGNENACLNENESIEEFTVTKNVINRYARGYHLYQHLLWVIDKSCIQNIFDLFMKWSENIIEHDITDYTTLNLRLVLLQKYYSLSQYQFNFIVNNHLQDDQNNRKDIHIILDEYLWISTLIHYNPNHQSLWLYQYTLSQMIQILYQSLPLTCATLSFDFVDYFNLLEKNNIVIEHCNNFSIMKRNTIQQFHDYYHSFTFDSISSIQKQFVELHKETDEKSLRLILNRMNLN